ncbi:hypothetical protein U1Q18_028573 [Sarracenia purpurea var. burkii]
MCSPVCGRPTRALGRPARALGRPARSFRRLVGRLNKDLVRFCISKRDNKKNPKDEHKAQPFLCSATVPPNARKQFLFFVTS